MPQLTRITFFSKLIKIFLILPIVKTSTQLPAVKCPNYFQYVYENSRIFGKITLHNITPAKTRLEVHLSLQGVVSLPNSSRLTLYDSQEKTFNNVLTGEPVSYRVEFPYTNILPKLTLITLNGAIICADENYPPPSSQLKLTHTLELSSISTLMPYPIQDNEFNAQTSLGFNNPFQQQRPQQPHLQHPQLKQQTNQLTSVFNTNDKQGFSANSIVFVTSTTPAPTRRSSVNLNEVCGRESATFIPLIRGGTEFKRGQFPWLIAIYSKNGTDLTFICGGTLLSTRTLISAAHCFKDQNKLAPRILLFLGRRNLAEIDEEGSEYRRVETLIIHPEYDAKSISDADIAILQMNKPVSFTNIIAPICLWNLADDVDNIVGYSAFVAGWGANELNDTVSPVPKKTVAKILDNATCQKSLQRYQLIKNSRSICANNENESGPCVGDSGGGLMIKHQGRWFLRGIVSAGVSHYGQCASNENFYFCDVAKHLNWIRGYILA